MGESQKKNTFEKCLIVEHLSKFYSFLNVVIFFINGTNISMVQSLCNALSIHHIEY